MKNDARFLGFSLLLMAALGVGGTIYERVLREKEEDARITKIQIIESRAKTGNPRVWSWQGAAMKPVLSGWKTTTAIGYGNPHQGDWYEIQGWGRKGIVWRKIFNTHHAQVFQKGDYRELTPQSAWYFRRLLATPQSTR